MSAPCFSMPVRVYFENTDAGGVVYHAEYLRFLERARSEWLRSLGLTSSALAAEHGVVFVVHELTIRYQRPARLDDALDITLAIEMPGSARIVFHQQILRDAVLLCDAVVTVASVAADSLRPRRIPAPIMGVLRHGH